MTQIWKDVLPVDDAEHTLNGEVVAVAPTPDPDLVLVWFKHTEGRKPLVYKVIGTGHEYDPSYTHVGTVQAPMGLVWHVMLVRDTAYDA